MKLPNVVAQAIHYYQSIDRWLIVYATLVGKGLLAKCVLPAGYLEFIWCVSLLVASYSFIKCNQLATYVAIAKEIVS